MIKRCCTPTRPGQTPKKVTYPLLPHGAYLGDVVDIPGGRALV
ncbi:MAG: hypothetical protein AAF701_03720 [Pseudomonadota bacterium]